MSWATNVTRSKVNRSRVQLGNRLEVPSCLLGGGGEERGNMPIPGPLYQDIPEDGVIARDLPCQTPVASRAHIELS